MEPEDIVFERNKKSLFYVQNFTFIMKDIESGAQYELQEDFGRPSGSTLNPGVPKNLLLNKFNKNKLQFIVKFEETENMPKKLIIAETTKNRKFFT